ncbi:MAG: isoprenylcysteine carboxylmethyltransferase family protein [Novosphingobium sp.]|nr:isoprenylcysteine carboxylmethyltransferase family protein [Novosphingobium sp.]
MNAELAKAHAPGVAIPPRVLDRAEQAVVVIAWSLLAWRVFHSPNGYAPLVLLSETAVALFVLFRRPTEAISLDLGDWLMAVTATAAPLLIVPGPNTLTALAPLGVTLVALGNAWQFGAKLILRRSFGIAPANRGVKVSGPYRLMRHPMYAGYLLVHIGVLTLMFSPTNLVIYAIGWWAQIRRMIAEERLLGEDPSYREYMGQVRWRLVPGVF